MAAPISLPKNQRKHPFSVPPAAWPGQISIGHVALGIGLVASLLLLLFAVGAGDKLQGGHEGAMHALFRIADCRRCYPCCFRLHRFVAQLSRTTMAGSRHRLRDRLHILYRSSDPLRRSSGDRCPTARHMGMGSGERRMCSVAGIGIDGGCAKSRCANRGARGVPALSVSVQFCCCFPARFRMPSEMVARFPRSTQ